MSKIKLRKIFCALCIGIILGGGICIVCANRINIDKSGSSDVDYDAISEKESIDLAILNLMDAQYYNNAKSEINVLLKLAESEYHIQKAVDRISKGALIKADRNNNGLSVQGNYLMGIRFARDEQRKREYLDAALSASDVSHNEIAYALACIEMYDWEQKYLNKSDLVFLEKAINSLINYKDKYGIDNLYTTVMSRIKNTITIYKLDANILIAKSDIKADYDRVRGNNSAELIYIHHLDPDKYELGEKIIIYYTKMLTSKKSEISKSN